MLFHDGYNPQIAGFLIGNFLHPSHFTLHPTSYTLHTTHYTLHTAPYALHPTHCTLHPFILIYIRSNLQIAGFLIGSPPLSTKL